MSENKTYSIRYLERICKNDIPALSSSVKKVIKKAIEERLMIDPIGFGKPLQYSLKGHRRLHVGDYRIIYKINISDHQVDIVAIKHRKDIYKDTHKHV